MENCELKPNSLFQFFHRCVILYSNIEKGWNYLFGDLHNNSLVAIVDFYRDSVERFYPEYPTNTILSHFVRFFVGKKKLQTF